MPRRNHRRTRAIRAIERSDETELTTDGLARRLVLAGKASPMIIDRPRERAFVIQMLKGKRRWTR